MQGTCQTTIMHSRLKKLTVPRYRADRGGSALGGGWRDDTILPGLRFDRVSYKVVRWQDERYWLHWMYIRDLDSNALEWRMMVWGQCETSCFDCCVRVLDGRALTTTVRRSSITSSQTTRRHTLLRIRSGSRWWESFSILPFLFLWSCILSSKADCFLSLSLSGFIINREGAGRLPPRCINWPLYYTNFRHSS